MIFASFFPKSLDNQYQAPETHTGDDIDIDIGDSQKFDNEMVGKKITNFSIRYSRLV